MDAESLAKARSLALGRLNQREYSSGELLAYLARKKIEAETAQAVVRELTEEGLINDARFARVVTRAQFLRGKGPGYIQNKLRAKGISASRTEVSSIIEEVGEVSELESARRVVESRYPRAEADRDEAKRAYQALVRRGFSFETARKAVFET